MYTPDPQEKFDFQNMDVKLYLALKAVVKEQDEFVADHGPFCVNHENLLNAKRVMYEFEQSFGPIPDWAVERNFAYELVPGAQLCTKDGRRTGNAHIVKMGKGIAAGPVFVHTFECLTDAGSKFTFTEVELLEAFNIGDWISDPARIIRDFDRNGEFSNEQ
ncbi:hypothetical protein D3C85_379660 [compost metagenome]